MEGDEIGFDRRDDDGISIHSLRMEGDDYRLVTIIRARHFNPLPPHGGRPGSGRRVIMTITFQSTPSAWRETHRRLPDLRSSRYFNPLPPHGGRRCTASTTRNTAHFNPLPPHGGRLDRLGLVDVDYSFQSTPSAWRETLSDGDPF